MEYTILFDLQLNQWDSAMVLIGFVLFLSVVIVEAVTAANVVKGNAATKV